MENFFQKGNLIALRELALRRTAERVDAQMESWRRIEAWRSGPWAASSSPVSAIPRAVSASCAVPGASRRRSRPSGS
jgi:two-component system sensor histidine kinase KdpD